MQGAFLAYEPRYDELVDIVSISFNTPSAEKHNEMCRPVYGLSAFDTLIEFYKNINKYLHNNSLNLEDCTQAPVLHSGVS